MTKAEALALLGSRESARSVPLLAKAVKAIAEAAHKGKTSVLLLYGADDDCGPLMDGLMELGFSRTLASSDGTQTVAVSW